MSRRLAPAWAAAITLACSTLCAAADPEPPPPIPEGYRDDPQAIEDFLNRSLARYREAKTMRFEVRTTTETLVAHKQDEPPVRRKNEAKISQIVFVSPNQWAIKRSLDEHYGDGRRRVWAYPEFCQYLTLGPEIQTDPFAFHFGERYTSAQFKTAPERLVTALDPIGLGAFDEGMCSVGIREGEFDGKPCVLISGSVKRNADNGRVGWASRTLFFEPDSMLLIATKLDWTDLVLAKFKHRDPDDDRLLGFECAETQHIDTVIDGPIDPKELNFSPDRPDRRLIRVRRSVYTYGDYSHQIEEAEVMALPPMDFELKTFDGNTLRLADLRGRVVVLDFWASWCGPCLQGMPHLQKVWEAVGDEPITIIGVCVDEEEGGRELATRHIKRMGITYPQVFDPERKVDKQYRVRGYPTIIILDRQGKVRSTIWLPSLDLLKKIAAAPPIDPAHPSRLDEILAVKAAKEEFERNQAARVP